ncbi:hypothetical protein HMN09_00246100 [Mycena chlorophos]|uniref:Uncharacterized protein n=1 Tax=Mycena chlorophos TaxID=658473 RepID=A0A8H6WLH2_MYCCL|nr:hypothetical protein HMN09_00246100 [Mycena chlorophos]
MYYSQNSSGWATDPPFSQSLPPTFQSQPQWSGSDFYNPQAVNNDPWLYDRSRSRTRRGSFDSYDEPYASDFLEVPTHRRHRSLSPMMYPSNQLPGSTAPMGMGPPYNQNSPYLGQYGSVPNQFAMPVTPSYAVPTVVRTGRRQRSVSMSAPGYGVPVVQPQFQYAVHPQRVHARQPQTIIVGSGHRKHRHHHHHHHKRSRSTDYSRHSRY